MKKKVWTAYEVDIDSDLVANPIEIHHIGSRLKRSDALDLLVDYIFERIKLRVDLRYAFIHDLKHMLAPDDIKKRSKCSDMQFVVYLGDEIDYHEYNMPQPLEDAIRGYLRAIVDVNGSYNIETLMDGSYGAQQFLFGVEENELEWDNEKKD